jgi:TrmH family RNA methyltransferase
MVAHALEVGLVPKYIAVSEDKVDDYKNMSVNMVLKTELFSHITDTVHSQGIVAVLELDAIHQLMKPESKHVVICDNIQDPGNLGTIIRTCDALGIYEVYLTKGCVDPYSSKVLRSTMGSLFKVNVYKGWDSMELAASLHERDFQIIATALRNSISMAEFKPDTATAIIFGNEGNGVSEELLNVADGAIRIPMEGSAESLNVGVAAGIVLYHLNSCCSPNSTVL